jgi:hypothetical protein
MTFQPEGYQPDGYQPVYDPDAVFPGVAASRKITLPSGGVWLVDPDAESFCEVDWSGVIDPGATLSSVAYTLPASLTQVAARIDANAGRSIIKVSGVRHGVTYQIQAVATLSTGQTLPLTAPLRGFNG